ncbi:MAG: hypothetical protein RJB13_970 [Pseudomonadota bacterium]
MTDGPTEQKNHGAIFAVGAYSAWGFVPLFWRELSLYSSMQILAHRIIWSLVFFITIFIFQGTLTSWSTKLIQLGSLKKCFPSALVIAVNWSLYIFAVNSGYALESSLGYFINPIFNFVLGAFLFNESLSKRQWLAFALALTGVIILTFVTGKIPWVALALASTFSLYGILRKTTKIAGTTGTAIESAVLVPIALIILLNQKLSPIHTPETESPYYFSAMLFLGGAVTALPLTWFAEAAQRLPLSTLGFYQFISPTFQFLIAVFVFNEPFDSSRLIAFIFIWTALGIFVADSAKKSHQARKESSKLSI